jgi:hypothetical protein
VRRREAWALEHLLVGVIVEPRFARFEAGDDGVAGGVEMVGRVLAGGTVATADVTALGAASQVKPPPSAGETFDTTSSARLRFRIDARAMFCHAIILPDEPAAANR